MDGDLPGEPRSYWLESTPAPAYPQLEDDVSVDVAVVGAGIAGITTASFLQSEGFDVALVEAGRVVQQVTARTTAKLTAAHGLKYDYLRNRFGDAQARRYADANQTAIDRVRSIVREQDISCDLHESPMYVYTTSENRVSDVADEVDAARQLGLPVSYTEDVPLPADAKGAVRYADQAYFHPRKYLLALVDRIPGGGSHVFERTRAQDIDTGSPHTLETAHGDITADHIVIATHFPFRDTGLYFARMYPQASHVLGVYLNDDIPEELFYGTDGSFFTLRPQQTDSGPLWIVDGQSHRTGHGDSREQYRKLASRVRDRFDVDRFAYRWMTQDYSTMDRVPYIGRLSPFADGIYVATGFGGWGMTHGTVAGILLTDQITGRDNDWTQLFTPNRAGPPAAWKTFVTKNVHTTKHFIDGRRNVPERDTLPALQPGDGVILELDDEKVAVSRDEDGATNAVSAVCTHMGCIVSWNSAEGTWDCACHGSRFTAAGDPIDGPAQEPLEEKDIEEQ